MNKCFIVMSFELHNENLLKDWVQLSEEIDKDIAKAEGFISRDSGVDEDGRVYCLVKWQSKKHQENFRKALEVREEYSEMMQRFGSIANMETATNQIIGTF